MKNQCDGCAAGMPTYESSFGGKTHRMGKDPWDVMGCTSYLYCTEIEVAGDDRKPPECE